jgi:hypothetical protein
VQQVTTLSPTDKEIDDELNAWPFFSSTISSAARRDGRRVYRAMIKKRNTRWLDLSVDGDGHGRHTKEFLERVDKLGAERLKRVKAERGEKIDAAFRTLYLKDFDNMIQRSKTSSRGNKRARERCEGIKGGQKKCKESSV